MGVLCHFIKGIWASSDFGICAGIQEPIPHWYQGTTKFCRSQTLYMDLTVWGLVLLTPMLFKDQLYTILPEYWCKTRCWNWLWIPTLLSGRCAMVGFISTSVFSSVKPEYHSFPTSMGCFKIKWGNKCKVQQIFPCPFQFTIYFLQSLNLFRTWSLLTHQLFLPFSEIKSC